MLAPPPTLIRLRDGLLRLGTRPTDTPDLRLRKQALVMTVVAIVALATVWTGTYLLLGLPLSAVIPGAYQVVSIVSLIAFARTGDLAGMRLVQIALMLVLPFALQWTLGGFVPGSAVMVWSFAAPLAALVLSGRRFAVGVFLVFLALTAFSGLIDPFLPQPTRALPEDLRLLFFVLNVCSVSAVTFAVLLYFFTSREQAQAETESLLHNILPAPIADKLRSGAQLIADEHPRVTVLFADIADFTPLARASTAAELISILDRVFTAFDDLAARHDLEKIKTIGDAYMVVAGAPEPRPGHARAAAEMALDMLDVVGRDTPGVGQPLALRIGMDTGRAVAGVIGRRKFAYDLWGDVVNVASRMELHGVPGRIQVTQAVVEALEAQAPGAYRFEERGPVDVKGVGEMRTWFLLGRAS